MAFAPMRRDWFVQVKIDGRVMGAGVLVDHSHVVTCAHVVGRAGARPDAPIQCELPFTAPPQSRSAHLLLAAGESPADGTAHLLAADEIVTDDSAHLLKGGEIGADDSDDVAILRLSSPVAAAPAPMRMPADVFGRRVVTAGLHGTLGPYLGPTEEWVRLPDASPEERAADHRLCGAPVLDEALAAVIGIAVRCDAGLGNYMIPARSLCVSRPSLARTMRGWWLDQTDPAAEDHWLALAHDGWNRYTPATALSALTAWLADPGGPKSALVTGAPGSGKSSVLAMLLVAADPRLGPTIAGTAGWDRARLPSAPFDAAVNARDLTLPEVVERLAAAADAPVDEADELPAAVNRRQRPFTVLVDSVDEAATEADADEIAALLRRLAESCPNARVLVGDAKRRRAAEGLEIDLDSPQYKDARLGDNPLVTKLSIGLAGVPRPRSVGDAVDALIDGSPAGGRPVRRLLTALAFARGSGFSPALAHAVAMALWPDDGTPTDLELLHSFESLLVHHDRDGNARLTHPAIAAHLRRAHTGDNPHAAVARALLGTVPTRNGHRDWTAADPYVLRHLAWHAARGGTLDSLINDGEFLASAAELLSGRIDDVDTVDGFLAASIYRKVRQRLRSIPEPERRRLLLYEALCCDADSLAATLRPGLDADPWRFQWVGHTNPHSPVTATGTTGWVRAVTIGDADCTPIAVTGGADGMVRVWDLYDRTLVHEIHADDLDWLNAVGVVDVDSVPVVVSGGGDGLLRVWDLRSKTLLGKPLAGETPPILAIATGTTGGTPLAVSYGSGPSLHVWDLRTRTLIGELEGHPDPITSVALGHLDGHPIAVSAGQDGTLRIWDLHHRTPLGAPIDGHPDPITSIALGHLDGHPIAVSAGQDGTLRIWDLHHRTPLGAPIDGHPDPITSIALGHLDGHPIVVSAGQDRTVRAWDLRTREPVFRLPLTDVPLALALAPDGTLAVVAGPRLAILAPRSEVSASGGPPMVR